MADPRFFAKLDVGYFDNPKVADFIEDQPRVLLLHLRAVVYCRQHLTDGRFPIRTVVRLACASYCGSQCEGQCDFCATVDAGLFVRIDSRTAEVHDYLKHQDSAEQVTKRRSAGQAAAAARWGKSADAKGNADRNAKGNAKGNAEERRGEERKSPQPRPEVEALCTQLADRIEANGAKRPTITKGWIDAARLMIDRDDRDPSEASRLIDWCQRDEFWRANVLSMPKFRERYDQLRLQSERGGLRAVAGDHYVPKSVHEFEYHDE